MAKSAKRGDRGAAAVEFALVLPILLLLVFGIVDFSRAYNAKITLSEAAAQGVRTLAVGGTISQAETAVQNSLQGSSVSSSDVSFSNESACTGTNTKATMTVTDAKFNLVTPLPSFVPGIPSTLTLSAVGARQCGS
jgi:Flp pilus assembly protein TadG